MHVSCEPFDLTFPVVVPPKTPKPVYRRTYSKRSPREVVPLIVNSVDKFYKPRITVRRCFTITGVTKYYPDVDCNRANKSFLHGGTPEIERCSARNSRDSEAYPFQFPKTPPYLYDGSHEPHVSYYMSLEHTRLVCDRFLAMERAFCSFMKTTDAFPVFSFDDEIKRIFLVRDKSAIQIPVVDKVSTFVLELAVSKLHREWHGYLVCQNCTFFLFMLLAKYKNFDLQML